MRLIMRYLFILLLAMYGCVTCPANQEVADVFVEHFAGHGECGNYDVIKEDVTAQVEEWGFCSDKWNVDEIVKILPDGVWSANGMLCYATLLDIKKSLSMSFPSAWNCKHPEKINYDMIEKECQEL
jgi:hypothetical protein